MSTESGTSNDSNEEKKPLRLRLGRKTESDDSGVDPASSETPPSESVEPETAEPAAKEESSGGTQSPLRKISLRRSDPEASDTPEPAKSGDTTEEAEEDSSPESGPTRPVRMRLSRSDETRESVEESPTEAETDEPVEGPVFSEEDFEDFDIGESPVDPEPDTSPPPAKKPEPEADSTPEMAEEEEEEGWNGAPESQLSSAPEKTERIDESPSADEAPPPEKPEEPQTRSGLKLKTRDPIGGSQKAPEGMSHGTLTPFERDKAVSSETPPPLPPPGKDKAKAAKKEKKPSKQKTPPPSGPPPVKPKKQEKESHLLSILVVLFLLILLIGGVIIGLAMVLGWGPFASDPKPAPPTVVQQPAPEPSPEPEPEPPPLAPPTQEEPETETAEVTPPEETTPPEEDPPVVAETEDGRAVIRVDDLEGDEITEGTETVTHTEPKPIEEETPKVVEPDPRITAFVNGMAISGTNVNRQFIIYNNTRYERNQFVDFNLGVQFLGIQGRNLYFRDQRGAIYIREF